MKTIPKKWIDITDDLTPEGIDRLKVGQIMMFDYEGSRIDLKVMLKRDHRVYVKPVKTYSPDQVQVKDKVE